MPTPDLPLGRHHLGHYALVGWMLVAGVAFVASAVWLYLTLQRQSRSTIETWLRLLIPATAFVVCGTWLERAAENEGSAAGDAGRSVALVMLIGGNAYAIWKVARERRAIVESDR